MSLKQRLAAGEPLLGTFFKTPSPMLCEVIAQTDIDFVCLDAEHSPFDRLTLDQCLFALRAGNMPGVVRVPALSGEPILNALDCGATGVVVPHVITADDAGFAARSAQFGQGRGFAGSTRAAGYMSKNMATHLSNSAA
ncbi:MAG: aldolase/citrate lyase family protein, partial [Parvibaculales bacterium]